MKGLFVIVPMVLCLVVATVIADYENDLEHPENQQVVEHHRSKRSPYDPLIPALLLGKSAFLLGSILGPKLLHRPVIHHRPYRHHGGWGWQPRGWGGWQPQGWGWK